VTQMHKHATAMNPGSLTARPHSRQVSRGSNHKVTADACVPLCAAKLHEQLRLQSLPVAGVPQRPLLIVYAKHKRCAALACPDARRPHRAQHGRQILHDLGQQGLAILP
jgi:hypothetical protein